MDHSHPGSRIRDPLVLRPRILPKVWGGRRLGAIVADAMASEPTDGDTTRPPAGDAPIGEAWLAWEGSIVEGGPQAGQSVRELVRQAPQDILGRDLAMSAGGAPRFPSLVKLLDTSAWLSVQVHPDDEYARRVEGEPFGKAEVWVVLAAEPGAQIIHGLRHAMAPHELKAAVKAGSLLDHVRYRPVAQGDVIFNPPGTIHALGPGILLYELQQASDLTYRLYDWDRLGSQMNRPLHIDKALDVARRMPEPEPGEPSTSSDPARRWDPLAGRTVFSCPYFGVEEIRGAQTVDPDTGGRSFELITLLAGDVDLAWDGGRLLLAAPATVLVPAAIGAYRLLPAGRDPEGCWLLRAYVP